MAYDNNLLGRALGGGGYNPTLTSPPQAREPWVNPQQRKQNDLQSSLNEISSRGPVYVRSKAQHEENLVNDDFNQSGQSFSSFYYPETETGNRSDSYYDYENEDLTSIHRMGIGTSNEQMEYNNEIYNVGQIPGTDRYAYPQGTPGSDRYNQYYQGPLEEGQDPYSMVSGTASSDDLWNQYYPAKMTTEGINYPQGKPPQTYNNYMGGY